MNIVSVKFDRNHHVKSFIMDYCLSSVVPQYAVLISGQWGSGKTWFINQFIRELRGRDGKELYVSLYGMSNFSEIEYEFFRKLHPVLSHKGMEITGKILKGALKGTLKIDLDRDGKSDGNASPTLPEIKLPDYLKNTSKHVLIFDDIERCGIPIESLLGYINHFVEHQDYKVILVANEEEITQKSKDGGQKNQYATIKEKLVGKTFKIEANLSEALGAFIEESGQSNFYNSHLDLIKTVYESSTYNNLRHLRQALLDFCRLKKSLDQEALDCPDLMAHLLRDFLIYSFEIRHGRMNVDEIEGLGHRYVKIHLTSSNGQEEKDSLVIDLNRKYPDFNPYDTPFDAEVWKSILGDGRICKEKIHENILKSRHLASKNSPNWVRLWKFRSLSDSDFSSLVDTVWLEFKNGNYNAESEIKHVCGIYMHLASISLYPSSVDKVLSSSKHVIDTLFVQGKLELSESVRFYDDESAFGMGYLYSEHAEFKEVCSHLRSKAVEAYSKKLPSLASELVEVLRVDPRSFTLKLIHSNHGPNDYYETPILDYLSPVDFVHAYLEGRSKEMGVIHALFKERYKFLSSAEKLTDEFGWLLAVYGVLIYTAKSNPGTLTSHLCISLAENAVDPVISLLGEVRAKNR
ncbi:hypothetical protein E8F11_06290 [Pseudomonas sp. BN417]|uniref:P-loop NTPase fold protein n=1 Tax=Pseudomonas sp. BN417 TaxID=2567890 RepID=UPI002454E951|nr:P-loop NTPase fold protein [Pseudomonas sp. BN417]MDH4554788.1 hypothetical protein [Pseudomonas sp. BN417]